MDYSSKKNIRHFRLTSIIGLVLILIAFAVWPYESAVGGEKILVFSAGSTINAINEVGELFNKQCDEKCIISSAASSTLAKQIAQGAPADIFISANSRWMDYLSEKDLIDPESRFNLLGNRLVLITPLSNNTRIDIRKGMDLAGILGKERLAMGDPDHVPAGIYGKEALENLGIWTDVRDRIAPMKDVRAALVLVERNETPYGIVYSTDARISKKVRICGVFPETCHSPITYPVAVVAEKRSRATRHLLDFLRSPEAKAVFLRHGFTVR
jgi:molybdate transport system substrate-binding protein